MADLACAVLLDQNIPIAVTSWLRSQRRERFVALLEWLAALGNAEGMNEWISDSEAARILAGRLRNDHA